MIKNMRAKAATDLEAGAEKLDKPSPAANFRRLSVAALNFFSGDKKKKDVKKKKSISDLNQNQRPSQFDEDDDLLFCPDLFAGGRRPSLLDVLGPLPNSGENTPMSSVLEQTTLADFIRIMSTLRSLEATGGSSGFGNHDAMASAATAPAGVSSARESRHPSLSHLFAGPPPVPREILRARGEAASTGNLPAKARRYSQAPVRRDDQSFRRRAASISQGGDWRRSSGRFAPPARASSGTSATALGSNVPGLPSLVITSPDGQHRFRVESVRRSARLPSHMKRYRGSSLSEL